jgi:hypothetical protein
MRRYHKLVGVPIETNSLYALLKNRCRIVPRLSNGVTDHLLSLAAVELRLGRLTRNDDANFCWEIHWILSIATVDYRKFGLLQDSIMCCDMSGESKRR